MHFEFAYSKIPKISQGAYIFQRPFLRRLFLEGLIFGGAYVRREICVSKSIGLAYSWKEIYRFCFVLPCIWGQFPSTSPPGGLYLERRCNGGFFALRIWGAYTRRGLFSEFYGSRIYFILQGFVFLTCEKHKMVVKTTNVTHTIGAFKFLVQFSQLFFLFKRPYCCTFARISARNNILMPNSIVWETSRHYAVPPPRFLEKWRLRNKRRLFPYWWSITSLIWQVLLIGRATWEICFNQSETLPRSCLLSDMSSVWNFCARFSDVISRRNQS